MTMVITVERLPSTNQKLMVGFTEQGLAPVEKVGARGSHGFPWGHYRNESTGVTLEAQKYTVAHGKNLAFGDAGGLIRFCQSFIELYGQYKSTTDCSSWREHNFGLSLTSNFTKGNLLYKKN